MNEIRVLPDVAAQSFLDFNQLHGIWPGCSEYDVVEAEPGHGTANADVVAGLKKYLSVPVRMTALKCIGKTD